MDDWRKEREQALLTLESSQNVKARRDAAHELGIVSHVAEDPVDAAHKLAAEFETRSPDAVAAAKFLMQDAFGSGESGALAAERRWQRKLIGSRNQRIAVARNLEKKDLPYGPRRIGA